MEIPSVIPTVSIADQLLPSEALMKYISNSLKLQIPRSSNDNQLLLGNFYSCRDKNNPDGIPQCLVKGVNPSEDDPAKAAEFANLFTVYSNLLPLFTSAQPSPSVSTQYTFGRLTRYAFSLGIGVIRSTNLHTPVKSATASPIAPSMTGTPTLVRDDPTTPLTWIALDVHPWRYDETRYSPTLSERFRFFGGIALTPDPGLVVGAGIGLVRGLTLEVGYGVLRATVLPNNEHVNTMDTKTRIGALGVRFVGIGYSFQ